MRVGTIARAAGIGVADVLLTAGLAVAIVLATLFLPDHWLDGDKIDGFGVALLVASSLPLLLRRRYPAVALLLVVPPQVVYHALDYPHEVVLPIPVVLIYTIALTNSRKWLFILLGITSCSLLLTVGLTQDGPPGVEVISPLGWFLLAAVGGLAMRSHRAYIAETSERKVAEERLRIARDLHDVLAHHIVVINSHAGVAAHLLDERAGDPALADSLRTIADASSEVLAELRVTLDVLRGNEVDADRQPAPNIDRLPDLAATTKAAGVDVNTEVLGERRALGPGVEVTLFRIAQEALTNVVKHSGARRAQLVLNYGEDEVRLEITDDGHGSAGGSDRGYGIVGMTERAHALGGRLSAGNGPRGGFQVVATVPTTRELS